MFIIRHCCFLHVPISCKCPESLYFLPSVQIIFLWHPAVLLFMAKLLSRRCFLIEILQPSSFPPFTFGLHIWPLFKCHHFLVTSPCIRSNSVLYRNFNSLSAVFVMRDKESCLQTSLHEAIILFNYKYIYFNFSQSTTIVLVYIMFIIYNIRASSFSFIPSSGPL